MDVFGILVFLNMNVINHVKQYNLQTIKNFNCRKNLLSKLVKEFSKNIDGNGMIYNATVNDHRKV